MNNIIRVRFRCHHVLIVYICCIIRYTEYLVYPQSETTIIEQSFCYRNAYTCGRMCIRSLRCVTALPAYANIALTQHLHYSASTYSIPSISMFTTIIRLFESPPTCAVIAATSMSTYTRFIPIVIYRSTKQQPLFSTRYSNVCNSI